MPRVQLTNPLQHPLAMGLAGIVLVIGVKLLPFGWFIALPCAALLAFVLAAYRRETTLPDLIRRSFQLASGADAVADEAGQRLVQAQDIGRLTAVQLCCERIRELPSTLERLRVDAKATGSSLLSTAHLEQRLRHERQRLGREIGTAVGRQRERLIQQLERNLALAKQGTEAGSLRVMAVSEHLESVAGDLQALQLMLRQPLLPSAPVGMSDSLALESDPMLDPLTADLSAELEELDQLLRDALGNSS